MIYLPRDIWSKIYSFDPTFKNYYDLEIVPLLKKQWYVTWICKNTGNFGFDLSLEDGINILDHETIFTYYDCKKICDIQNKLNNTKNFVPYNANICNKTCCIE